MMQRLSELKRIAEAIHIADNARLKRAAEDVATIEQTLARLQSARDRQDHLVTLGFEAAVTGSVHASWEIWAEGRKSELNLDLARARAEADRCRTAAAMSFGRLEALGRLFQRADDEARRDRRRAEMRRGVSYPGA